MPSYILSFLKMIFLKKRTVNHGPEGAIKDGKIRGEIFFKVECNHTKVEPFGWVLVVAFKINNSVLRICNSNSFFSSGKKKKI